MWYEYGRCLQANQEAERRDPYDATMVAHLSELYQSPRVELLPAALRFEQLHAVAMH